MAEHACTSCRSRKRKCDKLLPTCSLCTRKSLTCSYTTRAGHDASPPPPYLTPTFTLSPAHQSAASTSTRNTFPPVFFLDSKIFQLSQLEIPTLSIPTPAYLPPLIGEFNTWRSTAANFFDTVHRWLPIVSKARLYSHLLNPLVPRRTDVALLVLCMKLATLFPTSSPTSDRVELDEDGDRGEREWVPPVEYLAAKRLHADLVEGGGFSTQVLQSGVLIALYEYGHAIYPAAYLSIGACARYGISAGLDGSGMEQVKKTYNWVEEEEQKRVWWAVLILDRAVNLGNPSRSLATQEPHPSSPLPAADDAWDAGASSSGESFTLSSPTNLRMGRFARFAQAIYLLGRVYKHVSDQTGDHEFLQEEAVQLRRTIEALVILTDLEGSQSNKLEFCTQTALSYR
ncbi:putative fungal-specific transcription factor [Rhexocercosporidium sp. MPI-PUGE-AT-0058]|nr:putative fungal-specific transcription factor [Rhexocercosporidium sp. MPI-PUGE-AT-0058]